MKIYQDVRLADPFLKPYWRHERVVRMLRTTPPERCKHYDDPWVQGYRKFLFTWRRGESHREQLRYENPGLFYAYSLYDRMVIEPDIALMVEARLLAGISAESIANDCKTMPETIQWYERLFFNVSDFLTHHDWMMKNVLLPASDRFAPAGPEEDDDDDAAEVKPSYAIVRPHLDMTLKFFAYFGGPLICDVLISGFRRDRHVRKAEDISDYFNDQFLLQLQRRSAQTIGQFEINKYNVMELFATHTKLIELTRSSKSQEVRHTEFEKNVNAMLTEFPWNVGGASKQLYRDSPIGKYDDSAVELDSEEVILTGAGKEPDSLRSILGVDVFSRKEQARAKSK